MILLSEEILPGYQATRLPGYHVIEKNSDTIKKLKQIIADYQATWLPIYKNIYKLYNGLSGYLATI